MSGGSRRLPDLAVAFEGGVDGYGRLAVALHGLQPVLAALPPLTVFRCHRAERRLRLVGDVPLADLAALAGLARFGTGIGLRVCCSVGLPRHAAGLPGLPVLASVGGVSALVLDLSDATSDDAQTLRPAVRAALRASREHGLSVEVRGAIRVIRAAGALHDEFLDASGVTVFPNTAAVHERIRSSPELFFTVDGRWFRDEADWRRGAAPVGSVHGTPDEVRTTLGAALERWRDLRPDTDDPEGAAR